MKVIIIWISCFLTLSVDGADESAVKGGEFCQFESFEASCSDNEVIQIESAFYGRMRLGRCVTADLGFVGCSANVLDLVDHRCSGKQQCSISIPDQTMASRLSQSESCLTEMTMYLEANYTCKKIIKFNQRTCSSCAFIKLNQSPGTIASVTTRQSRCGSPECPWHLEASPGQRINITLVNYGWNVHGGTNGDSTCRVYATLKEVPLGKTDTLCAENKRINHIYTSLSHLVELRIVARDLSAAQLQNTTEYLFQYEFIGCKELAPPAGGWMTHANDLITMGCNNSKTTWTMKCLANEWTGENKTCPGGGPEASIQIGNVNLPSGLSIVIIIAVAFVVGALILCIGVIMFRRRYVRQHMNPPAYMTRKDDLPEVGKDSLYMPSLYSQDPQQPHKAYQGNSPYREQQNYTHIWERPLPNPRTDSSPSCTCPTGSVYGTTAHAQSSVSSDDYESEYNTLGSSDPVSAHTQNVNQNQSQSQNRRMVYGNNTIARKECEKLSPDSDIDPRYFQLDPDNKTTEHNKSI